MKKKNNLLFIVLISFLIVSLIGVIIYIFLINKEGFEKSDLNIGQECEASYNCESQFCEKGKGATKGKCREMTTKLTAGTNCIQNRQCNTEYCKGKGSGTQKKCSSQTIQQMYNKGDKDFKNIDLIDAKLNGINLTKAQLNDAKLNNANLSPTVKEDKRYQTLQSLLKDEYQGKGSQIGRIKTVIYLGDKWNTLSRLLQVFLVNSSTKVQKILKKKSIVKFLDPTGKMGNNLRNSVEYIKENRSKLIGANLTNAKLMGADLTGVSFKDADLTNAKLNNAKLLVTDFSGADLTGADFSGTNLRVFVISTETTFKNTKMKNCPTGYIQMSDSTEKDKFEINTVDFSNSSIVYKVWYSDIIECTFSTLIGNSVFGNCTFNKCKFKYGLFKEVTFNNCTFTNCTFKYYNIDNSWFKSCTFTNCKFTNIQLWCLFNRCGIINCTFKDILCTSLKFSLTNIDKKTTFSKFYVMGNIDKSNRINPEYIYSRIDKNCLKKTYQNLHFNYFDIERIQFACTKLRRCEFKNTKFWKANFLRTSIEDCDFKDASLNECDFSFSSIKNSNFNQIKKLRRCTFANGLPTSLTKILLLERNSLKGLTIEQCYFERIGIKDMNFTGSKFLDTALYNCKFDGCDFRDTTFTLNLQAIFEDRFEGLLFRKYLVNIRASGVKYSNETLFKLCTFSGSMINATFGNTTFNGYNQTITTKPETTSCTGWSCENVGQLCKRGGESYVCENDKNYREGCKNPPCWQQRNILDYKFSEKELFLSTAPAGIYMYFKDNNFGNTTFKNCLFYCSWFINCNLSECTFINCEFKYCFFKNSPTPDSIQELLTAKNAMFPSEVKTGNLVFSVEQTHTKEDHERILLEIFNWSSGLFWDQLSESKQGRFTRLANEGFKSKDGEWGDKKGLMVRNTRFNP